jgi:hypothetical protein
MHMSTSMLSWIEVEFQLLVLKTELGSMKIQNYAAFLPSFFPFVRTTPYLAYQIVHDLNIDYNTISDNNLHEGIFLMLL